MRCNFAIAVVAACFAFFGSGKQLDAQPPQKLSELKIEGAEIRVQGLSVFIELKPGFSGTSIEIPRLAAPLKSIKWLHEKEPSTIKVSPELLTWMLTWEDREPGINTLEMQLDAAPVMISEVPPIVASGDGSLFLPAHLAVTSGSKIRYEPQTFKNTVGYWAGLDNTAAWKAIIASPGKFNVAILQGCGAGQGGSLAEIKLLGPEESTAASLEFEVQETGHFQNFIWRHLGVIEIQSTGEFTVQIVPKTIKRGALMDVRAVHLIRLP